jgi:hypothetical protein
MNIETASPLLSHLETEDWWPMYYFAASTDSGVVLGCEHQHATVISAVACISTAGGYVVAVEHCRLRELNDAEEAEFQQAMHGGVVARVLKGITVTVSVKWSLS